MIELRGIDVKMTGRMQFSDFLVRGAAIAAAALVPSLFADRAEAQATYPNKPIRFMVGFPAGSGTDAVARLLASRLSERLGQPVIPDNRSGASGAIGVDAVAKSAPDGYTIGFGTAGALVIAPNLRKDVPYNPITDVAPVSMVVNNPLVLVATPSFLAQDLSQFLTIAKTKPNTIVYGSSGTGSSMHLAGVLLEQMAGVRLVHAPYKGNAPAVADLLGGQIPVAIIDLATAYNHVRQGKLKVLGTTGAKRSQAAPELPTFAESGVPGYSMTSWYGVIAPARTPPEIIKLLNSNLVAILSTPEVRERFLAAGPEPEPSTQEEFGQIIRTELERWSAVIKKAEIKLE